MEFNLPPVGGVDRTEGPAPSKPRVGETAKGKDFAKVVSDESGDRVDALPAAPPPELRAEIERASARYEELRGQKRELHFGSDPSTGRVVIEVRDLDGNVLRTVPPSKALDVISGDPLGDEA